MDNQARQREWRTLVKALLTEADPLLTEEQRRSVWEDFSCGEETLAVEFAVDFLFENEPQMPMALVEGIQSYLKSVGSDRARNLEQLAASR